MSNPDHWRSMTEAIEFAVSCVVGDVDPLNERELADGNQYIMRIPAAISETSLVTLDFENPSFLTMRESVRHLGAAGPDIDYDVAILVPGGRYRVTGVRGDAAYVGLVLFGAGGAEGASSTLESADIDDLIDDLRSIIGERVPDDGAAIVVLTSVTPPLEKLATVAGEMGAGFATDEIVAAES